MICCRKQKIVSARVSHTCYGGTWVALAVEEQLWMEQRPMKMMEWHMGGGDRCAIDLASKMQTREEKKRKKKRMKEKGKRQCSSLLPCLHSLGAGKSPREKRKGSRVSGKT
jgi:hypothetical protein